MLNVFSVDVEDYFQVSGFARRVDSRQWDSYESRVVASTQKILRLVDRHQIRATFFVLGWVADRFPGLVRDIQKSGHEIGSHSFWHRLIYDQTPEEFREDLIQSRKVLEEITGEPVVSYRAPSFSITQKSLWALDVLAEEGFRYDSSVFPVHHDRYGIPNAERYPHDLDRPAGTLWEFPPSVYRCWKMNLPVSGGGYFRLYPLQFTAYWLRRINRVQRQPFMFYIHPWEVDPDQPRLPVSGGAKFRHYLNLSTVEAKLQGLLSAFRFGALEDVYQEYYARKGQETGVAGTITPANAGGAVRIAPLRASAGQENLSESNSASKGVSPLKGVAASNSVLSSPNDVPSAIVPAAIVPAAIVPSAAQPSTTVVSAEPQVSVPQVAPETPAAPASKTSKTLAQALHKLT